MEVIHIDSSDDEAEIPSSALRGVGSGGFAVSGVGASPAAAAARTRLVTQESRESNDNSSVSSDDSIWDEPGLKSSSRSRKTSNGDILKSGDELEVVVGGGYENNNVEVVQQPHAPTAVDAWLGTWKVVMLMDHREFSCKNIGKGNFLQTLEKKVNNHFGGNEAHCEITTLPSADYMFVARLISHEGNVIDERVLDMIIERKDVNDLCQCIVLDSKGEFQISVSMFYLLCIYFFVTHANTNYHYVRMQIINMSCHMKVNKPLTFFENQMYKLLQVPLKNKLFLIEGDEDNPKHFTMISMNTMGEKFIRGLTPEKQQSNRLKRVKTKRMQLEKGEYQGVDLICTLHKHDTVKFLIEQLERMKKSFNSLRPPTMTMELLKKAVDNATKVCFFIYL